jgi:PAS domain S-box-containing protein/putative nucleotidyltransferase with HDIG domain
MPPSKLEKSIVSYVFRTGEALLLTEAKFKELEALGELELVGTHTASWLGAPLKTPTKTIGVLAVQNYENPDCYTERDKGFLSSVSAQVAVAIERKLAEESIEKSEKRFRALMENSLEEISLIDSEGNLTWESPTTRRPLGYPPNSFVGGTLIDIIHPDEQQEAADLLEQVIKTPGSVKEGIFRLRHKDGSFRWMEAVITNLLDEPAVQSVVINYRDVTERKQREDEIRSRTEELTMLYLLSRGLADAKTLEEVIDLVNRHAVESVHTTFACMALMEDSELVALGVHPVRNLEHEFILGERQPISDLPLCQRVMDRNEPVMLKTDTLEAGISERAILMLDFAQSVCLVPLWVGDPAQHFNKAIGLLILGEARKEKREPFTTEKIHLSRSIGDQAAAAIRRLLLREQAERRLQQLASMSEIDRTIASNFDVRISLQIILKHVIEQLRVDAADVLVYNNRTQSLEFTAGTGYRSRNLESMRQPMSKGQAGRALMERQIVKIPEVAISGAVFANPEFIKAENVAAYFAVPLITKGQIMGVLELCHRNPLHPNEEWFDFLMTLAGQAAIAIDNVRMFESLQRSTDELELAYDATIEGWSHALDLRDKETEGHTQRVTETTMNLARTFGLSERELINVRWGALLHDIGKMGVPDSILLKPGNLTEDEWVVMKRHPELAYEMLLPIKYLHGALDIPYCHHEWWDGSGYPRGLKGKDIPLAARIFAVVDVWDALISDRPYRQAWSEEKARHHIQGEAGKHFDQEVVKAFFADPG